MNDSSLFLHRGHGGRSGVSLFLYNVVFDCAGAHPSPLLLRGLLWDLHSTLLILRLVSDVDVLALSVFSTE